MFDKNDIAILKGMFETTTRNIIQLIRDETHAFIAASENRLLKKMDKLHVDVVTDVAEVLEISVFPKIEELQKENTRIKRHIALV